MSEQNNFAQIGDIFKNKKPRVKAPAYAWQDLALRIVEELRVPSFKRNSVFKICKENSREFVEKCLDDTKELAQGERWKYFFKICTNKKTPD